MKALDKVMGMVKHDADLARASARPSAIGLAPSHGRLVALLEHELERASYRRLRLAVLRVIGLADHAPTADAFDWLYTRLLVTARKAATSDNGLAPLVDDAERALCGALSTQVDAAVDDERDRGL